MTKTEKPWGFEELLESNDWYAFKKLFMKANESCSLQYHEHKHETIYVLSGKLQLEIGVKSDALEKHVLLPGAYYAIAPMTMHRMTGIEDSYYLEASTSGYGTHLNDVVRLEDKYGRV